MLTRLLTTRPTPSTMIILSLILLTTAAVPTAFMAQEQEDVIRACTRRVGVRKEITMMVIADSCEPGWTLIEWNQRGPEGPKGDTGAAGQDGAMGPTGDKGEQGPPGTANIKVRGTRRPTEARDTPANPMSFILPNPLFYP